MWQAMRHPAQPAAAAAAAAVHWEAGRLDCPLPGTDLQVPNVLVHLQLGRSLGVLQAAQLLCLALHTHTQFQAP